MDTPHPTPTGVARIVRLTRKQRSELAELLRDQLDQAGTDLGEAETVERFEQALGRARDLARIWRALDTGVLPVGDPVIRAFLTREHEDAYSYLNECRESLERVQCGQNLFGGTLVEQEAQVSASLDRAYKQVGVLNALLYATDPDSPVVDPT